jgi:hypothetical protein
MTPGAATQIDYRHLLQGDVRLLADPIAQRMLASTELARFAYVATDGTPRVIPIGWIWNGAEIVMATFAKSTKLRALRRNPAVAITIDEPGPPPNVLLIRGRTVLDEVDGVPAEYEQMQISNYGPEHGAAAVEAVRKSGAHMVRIVVEPTWVATLDFQTRFPGGLVAAGLAG